MKPFSRRSVRRDSRTTPGPSPRPSAEEEDATTGHGPSAPLPRRIIRRLLHPFTLSTLLAGAIVALVGFEGVTSRMQAHVLGTYVAPTLSYQVEPGPSSSIVFPTSGPYNERLGYPRIPEWTSRLDERGFRIDHQAQVSPPFHRLARWGLIPVYREKVQAGLEVLDRNDQPLFRATQPERVYPTFESVPPLIVETLLFIENRTLLDSRYPHRNPAVEWRRLARASIEFTVMAPLTDGSVPGASTLATQMEKFRHSPEGITPGPGEKLRQMASASLRTYLDGDNSMGARRRVAVDYLNSVPFAAIAGHGEVTGLKDGLWAWYGVDADRVSELLTADVGDGGRVAEELAEQAVAYRQVLSLLLAQRRPSWHLVRPEGRKGLDRMVDVYLDLLVGRNIISAELGEAARQAETTLRTRAPERGRPEFVDRKAANAVRSSLTQTLGLTDLYELDRLDLTVRSTFDHSVQRDVAALLARLHDEDFVQTEGLRAARLLQTGGPAGVQYAFTLYERGENANFIRVDTDNFEGPFNLNRGTKLDLGSTAKLRTFVHYLEVMEQLHQRFSALPPEELQAVAIHPEHRLAQWTVDFLRRRPDAEVVELLEAAMDRRYSASPAERFFTGGGVHTFRNFDRIHDSQVVSVRDAFAHSINLPFIRLMRDLVRHHIDASTWDVLQDPQDPRREWYLERFAHVEGSQFMSGFYRRYPAGAEDRTSERILEVLADGGAVTPVRLAWAFRAVLPAARLDEMAKFLRSRPQGASLTAERTEDLFRRANPSAWGLADLGYLAGIHPLELQVARHLLARPEATLSEVLDAGVEARLESYGWLVRTRHRSAQDQRIRILIEEDAFKEVHRAWRRLGYPFDALVPSYATAIGSSADRPDALTELVGILLNDGVRQPVERVTELHFAENTPYETIFRSSPEGGEAVLSPAAAAVGRAALASVVSEGTGRRLAGGIPLPGGGTVSVAGKTGTGNHTFKVFAPGGRLVDERPVNRTATFVFILGDRFFGTLTVFVSGEASGGYTFTSSLPAQVLRMLGPALSPLFESDAAGLADSREIAQSD